MNDVIRDFFDKHILPLNKKVVHGENDYLNIKTDASKESYFSDPLHPDYLYLTNISLNNEDEVIAYLNEFWKNEPELLGMIPDLAKLIFTLKEESKEQSAELSPFVYAMF